MKFETNRDKQLIAVLLMFAMAIGAFAVLAAPDSESATGANSDDSYVEYEDSEETTTFYTLNEAIEYAIQWPSYNPKLYVRGGDLEEVGGQVYDLSVFEDPSNPLEIHLEEYDEKAGKWISHKILFNPSDSTMAGYEPEYAHVGITFKNGPVKITGGTLGCTDFNREAYGYEENAIREVIRIESSYDYNWSYLNLDVSDDGNIKTVIDASNVSYSRTQAEIEHKTTIVCSAVTVNLSSILSKGSDIIANENSVEYTVNYALQISGIQGKPSNPNYIMPIRHAEPGTSGKIIGDIYVEEGAMDVIEGEGICLAVDIVGDLHYNCPNNLISVEFDSMPGEDLAFIDGKIFFDSKSLGEDYIPKIIANRISTNNIQFIDYLNEECVIEFCGIDKVVLDHEVNLGFVDLTIADDCVLELTKDTRININEGYVYGEIKYGRNLVKLGNIEYGPLCVDDAVIEPNGRMGEYDSIGLSARYLGVEMYSNDEYTPYKITIEAGKLSLYNLMEEDATIPLVAFLPVKVCSGTELRIGNGDTLLLDEHSMVLQIDFENGSSIIGKLGDHTKTKYEFNSLKAGQYGMTIIKSCLVEDDPLRITGYIGGGEIVVKQKCSIIAYNNTVFEMSSILTLEAGSCVYVDKDYPSTEEEFTGLTMKKGSWFHFADSKNVILGRDSVPTNSLYFKVEKGSIEGNKNGGGGTQVTHDYMIVWKEIGLGEWEQKEILSITIVFKVNGEIYKTLEGFETTAFGFNFGEFPIPEDFFNDFKGWYFENSDFYNGETYGGTYRALKSSDIIPDLSTYTVQDEIVLVAHMEPNLAHDLLPIIGIVALIALVIGIILRNKRQ